MQLKVPWTLWIVMVFLVRHLLLLGVTFMPTTGEEIKVLRELIHPQYLPADIPAALVLFLAMRRRPECGDWPRRLWRHGRWLLMASAAGYLLLLGLTLVGGGQPLQITVDEWILASVLLNVWILVYLVRSPLLRDLFADFPDPT